MLIVQNDLGECGCDKQLFVDEDCQKAFYCMDPEDIPDGESGEGCELQCAEDEILIADPRYGDGYWYCLKNTGVRPIKCPGEFRTGSANYMSDIPLIFFTRVWMFWI